MRQTGGHAVLHQHGMRMARMHEGIFGRYSTFLTRICKNDHRVHVFAKMAPLARGHHAPIAPVLPCGIGAR